MVHDQIVKKLVIMGDSAVGKTSLATKYLGKGFTNEYIPTLGANFSTKIVEINSQVFRVMIIDVAGQENFRLLREKYFVGASGVFLVFDLTRPFEAEDQVKPWVKEILQYTNNQGVPLAILGNKSDLQLLRQIEIYDGINAAAKAKSMVPDDIMVEYFETSAKFGIGVDDAFDWLIETIITRENEVLQENGT